MRVSASIRNPKEAAVRVIDLDELKDMPYRLFLRKLRGTALNSGNAAAMTSSKGGVANVVIPLDDRILATQNFRRQK